MTKMLDNNNSYCMKSAKPLDLIITYNMSQDEAKAYKLCLIWQELTKKEFPKYNHVKLRKTGDPRKSTLFKYCYKLIRETKGIINDADYKFYILAQLQVLKNIKFGDIHALISPECLVGDKAWNRWKLWKKHFDKKTSQNKEADDVFISDTQLKLELEKTKQFLSKQFDLNKENLLTNSDLIHKWASISKISPYFIALTPCLKYEGNIKVKDSFYKIYKEIFNTI